MNPDHCRVQRQIIENFSLADRISVVEAEMTSRPDVVASADVLIVNNISEWFVPTPEFRVTMWQFIRQHLKPGALLVTIPDIQTALSSLQVIQFKPNRYLIYNNGTFYYFGYGGLYFVLNETKFQ